MQQFGPNQLEEHGSRSPLKILWDQLTNVMVLILIAAAVVSALLGKATETFAIVSIVLLFVLLGFLQEYRAEQAMAALRRLTIPLVRVLRGGEKKKLQQMTLYQVTWYSLRLVVRYPLIYGWQHASIYV